MKSILIALMFGMLLNLGVASRANAATDQIDPKIANLVTVTHSSKGCQVTAKSGAFLTNGTTPVPNGLSGVKVICHGGCYTDSTNQTGFHSCELKVLSGSSASCEGCPDNCYVVVKATK